MSAGRVPGRSQQVPPGPLAQGTGFLTAPVAPVGLLTPPDGTRVDLLRDGAFPAAPATSPNASPSTSPSQPQPCQFPCSGQPGPDRP